MKDKLLMAAAATVVFGMTFLQFGLPFFQDEEWETITCADERLSPRCDEEKTLPRFFVELCGRDEVRFDVARFEGITPETEGKLGVRYRCGETKMVAFEFPSGQAIEPQEPDELREHLVYGEDAFDLWEPWANDEVEIAEARRRLLVVD